MKFKTLFNLRMHHDYYADGRCADFAISPTSGTEVLLRNHRARARPLIDGLRIALAATDAGNAFIRFSSSARFEFDLRLRNPDLPLFTEMDALAAQRAPLYTNTTPASGGIAELALTSRKAFGSEPLTVATPGAGEGFVLAGKPVNGVGTSEFELASGGSGAAPALVGYHAADKRLVLDTAAAAAGQVVGVRYPVRPPGPRDLFARVAIVVDESLASAPTATEFRVPLRARHARWAYYCVTDLAQDLGGFSIVNTSPAAGAIRFGVSGRTDLNATPDQADTVAGDLAQRYPDLRRIRFLSDEPVACRQAPRKGLELHLDGSVMPGTLPNPSVRDLARLPLRSGGGVASEDALFRILKVIANSGV